MKQIDDWFNEGRDYAKGVMLYGMFGKYKTVLAILRRGETELTRSKLNDCMNRLRENITKEIEVRTVEAEAPEGKKEAKQEDAYLISIDKKWKPMYVEMSALHARLIVVDTKEMRYALAVRITDIHATLVDLWQERDYYLKHGKKKEKLFKRKAKENLNDSELRKLLSLRSNLSAYEKHRLPAAQARLDTDPNAKNKKNLERTIAAIEKYKADIKKLQQDAD